jgi:hypothetical protein
MTKHRATKKPFRCDCVKLKRAIQAKIYEETKYMTPEEQLDYFRQAGERAVRRRAERAAENQK